MIATKNKIVKSAFEAIGIANYIFDIEPEQIQSALFRLDEMLQTWENEGILLGYDQSLGADEPQTEFETKYYSNVVHNLGVFIAKILGRQLDPSYLYTANNLYLFLLNAAVAPRSRKTGFQSQNVLSGKKGDKGDKGDAGDTGPAGADGADGASAYDVAVANGFTGTELQWLASLQGQDGASAYDVAVANGFIGTEPQWLASLHGQDGADGTGGGAVLSQVLTTGVTNTDTDFVLTNGAKLLDVELWGGGGGGSHGYVVEYETTYYPTVDGTGTPLSFIAAKTYAIYTGTGGGGGGYLRLYLKDVPANYVITLRKGAGGSGAGSSGAAIGTSGSLSRFDIYTPGKAELLASVVANGGIATNRTSTNSGGSTTLLTYGQTTALNAHGITVVASGGIVGGSSIYKHPQKKTLFNTALTAYNHTENIPGGTSHGFTGVGHTKNYLSNTAIGATANSTSAYKVDATSVGCGGGGTIVNVASTATYYETSAGKGYQGDAVAKIYN